MPYSGALSGFYSQVSYLCSLFMFLICVFYFGSSFKLPYLGFLFMFLIRVPYSGPLFSFLIGSLIQACYSGSLFGFLFQGLLGIWVSYIQDSYLDSLFRFLIQVPYSGFLFGFVNLVPFTDPYTSSLSYPFILFLVWIF